MLDTNHLIEFDLASDAGTALTRRLKAAGENVATTIICAEEQLRGWLAQIRRLCATLISK